MSRPALSFSARRATPALALALATLLAACAGAPLAPPAEASAAATAATLPAAWRDLDPQPPAADAAPTGDAWWRGFADPQLDALVEQALAANTDLALATSRVRQARALRDAAAAGAAPQLDAGASLSERQSGRGALAQHSRSLQVGLDASWELDLWGGQAAATRAATADLASSEAGLAATRTSLVAEVALAYVQLRGSQLQLRIARDNLAAQAQTEQLTRWRTQAGLASSLDAEQARAATAQARAGLPALQTTIAQTGHRLALLLDQPPAALRDMLGDPAAAAEVAPAPGGPAASASAGASAWPGLADAPWPALPQARLPATGVPAELLRRRPDLRAAEATIAAEAARVDVRRAAQRPSFSIGGSLALQAGTLAALGQPAALLATLTPAVQWPLLDGGARAAQLEAQQAVLEQARLSYRAALQVALQDVEDALADLASARQREAAYAGGAAAARNALLLARQRYQAGLVDFATLLEAQRSALGFDNGLATARTDLALGQIRLHKALGGGWTPPAP